MERVTKNDLLKRDVTQFGSVSALGAESRRFESCHPELQKQSKTKFFLVLCRFFNDTK